MKRAIPVLFLVIACCLMATMCGSMNRFDEERPGRQEPVVLSKTNSVPIPDEVEFAGEKTDLLRYDLRERFDREINSFCYTHSTTMLLIKRANRIFPIIEPILACNGVPDDMKYLCVIESNLNPRSYSSAGAAGLWQFMKGTAGDFGMEVNENVDERYSIEISTEAACKYLKQAYEKFGSWAAAAISYNAGQGRITKELAAQKANDALDLLLVEESTRYYYRMLAIKQVFDNPQKYGFFLLADQLYKPMDFKSIEVRESIDDLAAFAVSQGVTYSQLKDFNVWLRSNKLPVKDASKKSYIILVPTQESLYYDTSAKPKVHNPAWVVEKLPQMGRPREMHDDGMGFGMPDGPQLHD